jgi:hypothetical protein
LRGSGGDDVLRADFFAEGISAVTSFDKDPPRMAVAAIVLLAALAGSASAAPPVAVDPNKAVIDTPAKPLIEAGKPAERNACKTLKADLSGLELKLVYTITENPALTNTEYIVLTGPPGGPWRTVFTDFPTQSYAPFPIVAPKPRGTREGFVMYCYRPGRFGMSTGKSNEIVVTWR